MDFLIRIALTVFLVAMAPACASGTTAHVRALDGTFIQLTNDNAAWPAERWDEMFEQFRTMGLRQIIVQWSEYDAVPFDTPPRGSEEPAPIESILSRADKAGMSVLVGTIYDSTFWQRIDGESELVGVYLQRLSSATNILATRMSRQLKTHSSFAGWYISQEVDDTSWRDPAKQPLLARFFRNTATLLRAATPHASITVSGFANGAMDTVTHGRFWDSLLEASKADTLFFQDGIGAGKLTLDELPIYLPTLREAAQHNDCELALVVELFATTQGGHGDAKAFRAEPATIARVQQQLALAYRHDLRPVAFSVPDYMSAHGSAAERILYNDYSRLLGKSSPP